MSVNKPEFIVVHCSDTPDRGDGYSVKDIDEWHKKRGFKSPSGIHVGYHFYIRRSGLLEHGRPIEEIGAHTKNHNKNSIGICYDGRNQMTSFQLDTFISLYIKLRKDFGIEPEDVWGHNEFIEHEDRACPNIQMNILRKLLSYAVAVRH